MKTRVLYLMLICVVAATVYSLTESPNTQENLRQNNDTKTSTGKNNSEKFLFPGGILFLCHRTFSFYLNFRCCVCLTHLGDLRKLFLINGLLVWKIVA